MTMKIEISGDLISWQDADGTPRSCGIGSAEGFRLLSKLWLRSGWDTKYVYGFSWMGRPVIQLPEDMIRIQEVIYSVKPDVVIETGIAHGGSLIYYASLLKAMGKGRVLGVDIEIRPHNRRAIEAHEMYGLIDMIEGSSVDPEIVSLVEEKVDGSKHGLVLLDSNHTKAHVLAELRAYAKFVGVGSYMIACDGIMKDIIGAPRTNPRWATDNPQAAVEEFLRERDDFVLEEPHFPFNEGEITERVTYWPNAFLRKVR
jgi:cephalosporin hydroxylase